MSTIQIPRQAGPGRAATVDAAEYRAVCEQKAQVERELAAARHRLTHDGLTGLPNREGFTEAAEDLIQARSAGRLEVGQWLLLADLDAFKPVNDTYGHDVGDEVLVAVGDWFSQIVGTGQVISRLHGDEFAVIVDDFAFTCLQAADLTMELTTSDGVELRGKKAVSVSIGAAPMRLGLDLPHWLKRADAALRRAKAGGGDAGLAVWDAVRDDDADIAERPLVRTRDLDTGPIVQEVA